MNKAVFTGRQVKELLGKVSGAIYMTNGIYNVPISIFKDFTITENEIKINLGKCTAFIIPISDSEEYTNLATPGEDGDEVDEALRESWNGSTYFEYEFEIADYQLYFNTSSYGIKLTFEQFKELTDVRNYSIFKIMSIDTGSFYIDMDNCTINVDEHEIGISSARTNTIFDESIINAIYNDSDDSDGIAYRVEFNNGMPDIEIAIDYKIRIF